MVETTPSSRPVIFGLSARLLLLTIAFVMVAEFLIYAPSISRFRKTYLEEAVAEAHLAALALEATSDATVSPDLQDELLFHAGAYAIVLKRPDRRVLMLSKDMPPRVDAVIDMTDMSPVHWLADGFATLFQRRNRVLRVVGDSPKAPDVMVEAVIDETPLRLAMYDYSVRILGLSIVISLITAGAVYFSLQWLLVRPMRRITGGMARFQEDPEDESRIIVPVARADELGLAERQLAVMQRDVHAALVQKERLATLGAAVAKINHDLRNSLATAMLVHDRLANLDDPEVKKVTPRLFNAIDAAVNLCRQTLNYVGDGVARGERETVNLRGLAADVEAALRMAAEGDPRQKGVFDLVWKNDLEPGVTVEGDRRQLARLVENLARNAGEAGAATLTLTARRADGRVVLAVADDGPGLPPRAKDRLFQPFVGSTRAGGTGLGLVIVRDIAKAHGGNVVLTKSDSTGAMFQIDLPPGA
ncbi:MAG: HAMP domain-containing sensor histidine kinase [Rhodospirillales bacterium]|jgi:signal transduction histidine kinase|nr:HAMP domain-containing sensor histidine kinase [Rhodospirillales bacterium]